MKNKYSVYTILFLILSTHLFYSCKTVKMSDADFKFDQGEYFEAASMYRKIYRKSSQSLGKSKDKEKINAIRGEASFKMGECYRRINNVARANAAYVNAAKYLPDDSLVSLQYARVLHKNGNYALAIQEYQKFLSYFPDNKFAQNGLAGAEFATKMKANPIRCIVQRSELFNSRRSDFSPMLLPPDYDNLYLTSSRDEATGSEKSSITGLKNNDIFMSRKDETGKWMKPTLVEGLNTEYDEGTPSFSASGNAMYYTYCMQDPLKPTSAEIYLAQRSGGAWGKGAKFEISKDTVSVFAHPSINATGDFLYFVSDMPGGFGGKDIWRAYIVGNNVDYVENLGDKVNTAGDELFPYMRNDSTLYFSSDGHPGMGGLDLFKAKFDAKTKNWNIENLGSPINSSADDFGITFEGEKERGFFSSNRNEPNGNDHIYSFEYPSIKIALEGYVVDQDYDIISGATIYVVGDDGVNEKFVSKQDGTYHLEVAKGINYVLLASGKGYLNSKMNMSTANIEKDSLYYVDFVLQSITDPGALNNIFYDFDKAALRDESKHELDSLVSILEINPHITIELSAHTDRKGQDDYNIKLSQRRAQSVVDYLIEHGVKKDRLVVAGYGKTRPKVVTKKIAKEYEFLKEGDTLTPEFIDTLTPEQQVIADQINRRTEFFVLTTDYSN
ncbi:MAG: OmpA family protein [Dysgonomonas sp.]